MTILITFILLSIVNVIFSTVRSLATIKSGKTVASLINAGYYSFYTVVLIYTVADFPLWEKCLIVFICNLIGVYVVKLVEEKARKDKLWLVQATFNSVQCNAVIASLKERNVPHSYVMDATKKYCIFNIYCATQKESTIVKNLIGLFDAKYFASESKIL